MKKLYAVDLMETLVGFNKKDIVAVYQAMGKDHLFKDRKSADFTTSSAAKIEVQTIFEQLIAKDDLEYGLLEGSQDFVDWVHEQGDTTVVYSNSTERATDIVLNNLGLVPEQYGIHIASALVFGQKNISESYHTFLRYWQNQGLEPTLFVDDTKANVIAASTAVKALHLNTFEKYLITNEPDLEPDLDIKVVKNLGELIG
jgi:phosphoglycolate phosphatase-like HAD superfamily hydrolase